MVLHIAILHVYSYNQAVRLGTPTSQFSVHIYNTSMFLYVEQFLIVAHTVNKCYAAFYYKYISYTSVKHNTITWCQELASVW